MKTAKLVWFHYVMLMTILAIYTGLFLATESLWVRGISLLLVAIALFLKSKYQWKFVVVIILIFSAIMLHSSIKEIPKWVARVPDGRVGTDTVWGRDDGCVDSLIFTVIHNKKCIVPEEGWYNNYIETIAADILITDEMNCKVQDSETALASGFEEVGWMHIDTNFVLLSDEANARFKEGERVYLYINPSGLSEAAAIEVWNDAKGNIYVKSCDENDS